MWISIWVNYPTVKHPAWQAEVTKDMTSPCLLIPTTVWLHTHLKPQVKLRHSDLTESLHRCMQIRWLCTALLSGSGMWVWWLARKGEGRGKSRGSAPGRGEAVCPCWACPCSHLGPAGRAGGQGGLKGNGAARQGRKCSWEAVGRATKCFCRSLGCKRHRGLVS